MRDRTGRSLVVRSRFEITDFPPPAVEDDPKWDDWMTGAMDKASKHGTRDDGRRGKR